MAFYRGPKIVTDGLVLALDAANTKSYVSGSTTWNDLSGNGRNATLTNGPSFNSENGGGIVFNGTNQSATISSSDFWRLATSSTVSMWCKPITNNGGYVISFQKGSWQGWVFQANGGVIYSGQFGGNDLDSNFGSISFNTWQQWTLVVNRETAQYLRYKNGVFLGSSSITQTAIPSTSPLYLGFRGQVGDNYANANIASLSIYNRALSAAEIAQNYYTLKSRFNLT
jgi:hypothetical protein